MVSDVGPEHSKPDANLRHFIYRHFVRRSRAPAVAEMATGIGSSLRQTRAALNRLCQTHAFVLQENGELWRAAPFSAVPTAFPVRIEKRSYYGNCIWDALGIPAMLNEDADLDASCGCCNLAMPLRVRRGKLLDRTGLIHIAVPARHWYDDIVFT